MEKSLVFYDSLTDFHAACPLPGQETGRGMSEKAYWSGNQSYKQAYANLWKGMPDAVTRSDKILEELESDGLEIRTQAWQTELVGFFPCVPAFISGDPESMFAPIDTPSDTAPMRVFASVCLSSGFDAKQLEKRGIAILALVRRLTLIRPVELYIYSDQYGQQPVIKLETTPLDLTTASYALANPAFLRKLCFAWGYADRGFEGSWAKWGGFQSSETVREALGANPQDLVITGSYLGHADLRDPITWINEHLNKYGQTLESIS